MMADQQSDKARGQNGRPWLLVLYHLLDAAQLLRLQPRTGPDSGDEAGKMLVLLDITGAATVINRKCSASVAILVA